jgi:hypothetical protein
VRPEVRAAIDKLSRDLVDKGLLIEAGWLSFRAIVIPEDAGAVQVNEMRNAFFAGAQHLYGSIMGVLDDGDEPTDADMRRMEFIDAELKGFIRDFSKRHGLPGGEVQ